MARKSRRRAKKRIRQGLVLAASRSAAGGPGAAGGSERAGAPGGPGSGPRERSVELTATFELLEAPAVAAAEGEESDDDGLDRFRIVANTGTRFRQWWSPYPVIIDMAGVAGLDKARPLLKDHSPSMVVGHTTRLAVEDGVLIAEGVASSTSQVAQDVCGAARNGFPWQASAGGSIERVEKVHEGAEAKVNGRVEKGPVTILRRMTLREISVTAIGADDNTSTSLAAGAAAEASPTEGREMGFDAWLAANVDGHEDLSDAERARWRSYWEANVQASAPAGAVVAAGAATATADDDGEGDGDASDVQAGAVDSTRAQVAAEMERINRVNELTAGHIDLQVQAIREGWSAERTELAVLRASRPQIGGSGRMRDRDAAAPAVFEASLLMAHGMSEAKAGKLFDDTTMDRAVSAEYRDMGLKALLYAVIQAAGMHVNPGRDGNGLIEAAFEADRQLRASGFSTLSLSGVLSNVANKSLLAMFEGTEGIATRICDLTDHSDFKGHTRYRLTGSGEYEKLGPAGELKSGTISEESYTNQLETQGKILTLTREMMINDDLGALLKIAQILGRNAKIALEKAVFTLILANTGPFFAAGNKNLSTGAGSVLDVDGLTAAEQLFLDQTDSAGDPILVAPELLVVPTSLKVTAQQLMVATKLNETTTTNKGKPVVNPHSGKFEPLASPYLNSQGLAGSSATGWYLFANPAVLAAFEIAFLRGRRQPVIEGAQTNFNSLGMQWRSYWDFGVAQVDHRGAVKSDGA